MRSPHPGRALLRPPPGPALVLGQRGAGRASREGTFKLRESFSASAILLIEDLLLSVPNKVNGETLTYIIPLTLL